jgi:serine/threonine-protein kinase
MSESEKPPVTGLVAGKYEVLRRIGRGGMGSVWEGKHASLGSRVAIKFIDHEHAESTDARSRFLTEARAAATIQSKHAIQIFDHGVTEDGRPYMVMELLAGESLDKRLDQRGRITLEETARILNQVCRALQRAHDAGIIHRDLKPENIFLVQSPDEDDETAKVLDFGIAKIKGPPGELTSSTKTGAVLGTPYFMSPEQARGLRNLDYRSDLWSLGVIAYKCVTGNLPFDGESVGDLLVKICTSPVPVPSASVPGLPPSFDAWFARALEREPDARFSSATELSEGLLVVAGLSLRRGPTSSQNRQQTSHVQAATPPPPSSALTPLAAGGITSTTLEASAMPPKTSRAPLVIFAAAALVGLGGAVAFLKVTSTPTPTALPASTSTPTATSPPTTTSAAAATSPPTPTATLAPTPDPAPSPTPSASAHAAAHPPAAAKPAVASGAAPKPTHQKPAPSNADPGY